MEMSEKKIKYLVADTTAFINVVQLHEYAENILTVPDVIEEVKHKRQIRRLVVLPFDLQIREPHSECLKFVTEFSKKTGDYASLSAIDLKIIALTYELEKEHVGSDHIKTQHCISRVVASKKKPEELIGNTKLAGFYVPKKGVRADGSPETDESESESESEEHLLESEQSNVESEEKPVSTEQTKNTEKVEPKNAPTEKECHDANENDDYTEEELEKSFANLNCDSENATDILAPTNVPEVDCSSEDEDEQSEENEEFGAEDGDDYNDDSGWITPSNIKKVKKDLEGKIEDEVIPVVACMSTDFAIQNVLKQMNLNVSALNGRVIKHVRTYILRCYTCFKTTSVMTKVFCPICGNKTLKKVAVSLDENGQQVIHINTRRPLTAKYKNQSLPRFKGGKHSRNPLLFEDQPMPRQMPSRVAKTKTTALNEDYTAGYSPFVMRDVDSKSAVLRSQGNLKEWARNNNFEEDRRRKHYNRLVK
ncbi:RNA-binding protein NOB1 [Episyrphus balteatus]|uniref:RNA-binding protein NOB1 n=1 Tax=Episyrphus balteatus TaxID=286459 RepID=UPI002485DE38|nr:RNA-binding protein NOB1 [Episyrphus balteatus]